MEQELTIQGHKVYPGSSVSIRWIGVWYDGTVVEIGPQGNLFKVVGVGSGQKILIESKQLKQLDSKVTQSQQKLFAFNDGDSWLEVKVIDSNATGAAKVSWRKNVYSLENETWFAKEDIAPFIQDTLQSDSLHASRSGLFPVRGIEEHPRTVKNVAYESDSEGDMNVNVTINPRPNVPHPNQSTPNRANHNSNSQSFTPHSVDYLPPQSWEPPHHGLGTAPIVPPVFFSRLAPKPLKNIAQCSMPCVWSYGTECPSGISPHYTSNFFQGLRERVKLKPTRGRIHNNIFTPHQSSLEYQSQSQQQTMKRNEHEELGRRHSLYDQFVLHKDTRLQELTQTRPTRRAQIKLEGLPPTIVSVSPGMITSKVGENILLTCTSTGTPPIEYKWLKDGKELPSQSTKISYPGHGLFQVNKVTAQDEGIYSCEVSNIYGSAVRYFNLAVQAGKENEVKTLIPEYVDQKQTEFDKEIDPDVDVQEYLDAIVDEFRMLENESEYDIQEGTNPTNNPSCEVNTSGNGPTPIPKISVSKAFNDEMEHYLFGYGENYGELSSSNLLPNGSHDQSKVKTAYDDLNSVEVQTSLDSSQSENHSDDYIPRDMQLPVEVESVFDQVQRFHSSMEQDEIHKKAPQKKWFNRIFSKNK